MSQPVTVEQAIERLQRLRDSEAQLASEEAIDPECRYNREHVEAIELALAAVQLVRDIADVRGSHQDHQQRAQRLVEEQP